MKQWIALLAIFLIFVSCATVQYYTYYEGGHDPLYNISEVKTIGFMPICWTDSMKINGYDELVEKQMFVYARDELQKRGFRVFFIPPEFIQRDFANNAFYVKSGYRDMPDLTLMLFYWQGLGNKVQVPGQGGGWLSWGKSGGGGYYGQTQGYEVQTYFLVLQYTLWSGAPKYMNKVWEGTIKKGSPKLDLFEQAPSMAAEIFHRKFDR